MLEITGYRLLRQLDRDDVATVYLAVQKSDAREVVLKVMSPGLLADPNFSERFLHQAQIAASLPHRRIVRIPDAGPPARPHALAMAYPRPRPGLPRPILSWRRRRIVFIPTTRTKFIQAAEINDLYDESPLEDRLWAELRRLQIPAERQEFVRANKRDYALDFAIYCVLGNLYIETDGDTWHIEQGRAAGDNLRDNALETKGWKLLRFNTQQINEQMADYCMPTMVEKINRLEGGDGACVDAKGGAGAWHGRAVRWASPASPPRSRTDVQGDSRRPRSRNADPADAAVR